VRIRPSTLLWLVGPPVAAAVAVVGGLMLRGGSSRDVEVREAGAFVERATERDAIRAIQARVPFALRVPRERIGGVELQFVDAGNSPQTGQPMSGLGYSNNEHDPTRQSTVSITQSNRQIPEAFTADMMRLDAGISGADVRWFPREGVNEEYSFVTLGSDYLLITVKGVIPPQSEMLAMIRSAFASP